MGDAGWRVDAAGVNNAAGGVAGRGGLDDGPGRALEGDGVDAAELDGDAPPGGAGASFGDADEQQGEPAQQHVGADAGFEAVEDGAQLEGGLEVAEAAFGFEEVLVAERDVLGGQVRVARWTAGTCRRVVASAATLARSMTQPARRGLAEPAAE